MDPRLQRRIQRYGWDRAAATYEKAWADQLRPAQELLLDIAAPRPGERVLDVACGTGIVSIEVAARVGPEGRIVGTDLSDAMVAEAKVRASARGVGTMEFCRRDAEGLFGDGPPLTEADRETFDLALCSLGLMYVPDPMRALTEMRQALVPGGRAVAAVWGARKACGWAHVFPIVDARVRTDVCPLFFQLGTGPALAEAFDAAGFRDVDSRRIPAVLRYESEESALQAAFEGGPVAMAYGRFGPADRADVHREYLTGIEPFKTGMGYDIPGEFVVVRGVVPATGDCGS